NKDNIDDLVVVYHATGTVGTTHGAAVMLGQGGAAFGSPVYLTTGKNPVAVVADEVTSDAAGNVDIVVADEGSNDISVFEGRGNNATLFDAAATFKTGNTP